MTQVDLRFQVRLRLYNLISLILEDVFVKYFEPSLEIWDNRENKWRRLIKKTAFPQEIASHLE